MAVAGSCYHQGCGTQERVPNGLLKGTFTQKQQPLFLTHSCPSKFKRNSKLGPQKPSTIPQRLTWALGKGAMEQKQGRQMDKQRDLRRGERTLGHKIEDGSQHPTSIKLLGQSGHNHCTGICHPSSICYRSSGFQLHTTHTATLKMHLQWSSQTSRLTAK